MKPTIDPDFFADLCEAIRGSPLPLEAIAARSRGGRGNPLLLARRQGDLAAHPHNGESRESPRPAHHLQTWAGGAPDPRAAADAARPDGVVEIAVTAAAVSP